MITVVGNLKGGTGKSTVVFNFALWLATRGVEVTLCDLDPQGTLADAVDVRREEGLTPALRVLTRLPERADRPMLIDVGTADMDALRAAVALADQIIIPVAPSQADVWSTQRFTDIVAKAAPRRPRQHAFVNRADTHPAARENEETEEALRQLAALDVLPWRLSQRTVFRRSFSEGRAVFELEPNGKASAELAKLAEAVFGEMNQ